jgi:hypothetical protein
MCSGVFIRWSWTGQLFCLRCTILTRFLRVYSLIRTDSLVYSFSPYGSMVWFVFH